MFFPVIPIREKVFSSCGIAWHPGMDCSYSYHLGFKNFFNATGIGILK